MSAQRKTRADSRTKTSVHTPLRFGLPPNKIDIRRYHAFKSGQSAADIAAHDHVGEKAVEHSIQRVRAENQQYSAEEAGLAVRRIIFRHLGEVDNVLTEALNATTMVTREVIERDPDTGKDVQLQESVERPDHETRLKAITAQRELLSVVQPRDPAVLVDNRVQTNNILNPPATGAHGSMTSPEAVIRSIQAQRGNSLTDGSQTEKVIEGETSDDDDEEEADGAEDDVDEVEDEPEE